MAPSEYIEFLQSVKSRLRQEALIPNDVLVDIENNEMIHDLSLLQEVNHELHTIRARWFSGQTIDEYWPDNLLVIGRSGCGDYYCISTDKAFSGVKEYDHEEGVLKTATNSISEYYEYIMKEVRDEYL